MTGRDARFRVVPRWCPASKLKELVSKKQPNFIFICAFFVSAGSVPTFISTPKKIIDNAQYTITCMHIRRAKGKTPNETWDILACPFRSWSGTGLHRSTYAGTQGRGWVSPTVIDQSRYVRWRWILRIASGFFKWKGEIFVVNLQYTGTRERWFFLQNINTYFKHTAPSIPLQY